MNSQLSPQFKEELSKFIKQTYSTSKIHSDDDLDTLMGLLHKSIGEAIGGIREEIFQTQEHQDRCDKVSDFNNLKQYIIKNFTCTHEKAQVYQHGEFEFRLNPAYYPFKDMAITQVIYNIPHRDPHLYLTNYGGNIKIEERLRNTSQIEKMLEKLKLVSSLEGNLSKKSGAKKRVVKI